jgi:hypothetical protein
MSKNLDYILQERKLIRRKERKLRRKARGMNLEKNILSKLPSGLVPGNAGNYNDVTWRFTYTIDFDFGTTPTYDVSTIQTRSFQNTQEAAFIFGWINKSSWDDTDSSLGAPLQLRIVDRQSTRQFNDLSFPLQVIPEGNPPLAFEVPLIIMPSAFIDFTINSWLAAPQITTGEGKFSFCLHGYRVRTNDVQQVLSTIFGR